MLTALNNGSRGMSAHSLMLDTVAQNLANAETTGYKKSYISFREAMYREIGAQGLPVNTGSENNMYLGGPPVPVLSTVIERNMGQGSLENTGQNYDLAIQGKGYFRVELPGGGYAYSRSGALHMDNDGYLATEKGHRLQPNIQLQSNDGNFQVGRDGKVWVENGEGEQVPIGQVELFTFNNPGKLKALGRNLFTETEGSGTAAGGVPGQGGLGTVLQGYLEQSNVELVEEMTNMVLAQRAYQFNARSVTVADEMWSLANNLRR